MDFLRSSLSQIGLAEIMTLVISVAALLTSFYSLYKSHLERVKVVIFTADTVGLVVQRGTENAPKFNLLCNITNRSSKIGTVHKLEANMSDPHGQTRILIWKLFYEYLPGGEVVNKTTDTHPISILPRDSRLVGIQFEGAAENEKFYWTKGMYEIEIVGWVNRRNRREKANTRSCFHIYISQENSIDLRYYTDAGGRDRTMEQDPHHAVMVPVSIREWSSDSAPDQESVDSQL